MHHISSLAVHRVKDGELDESNPDEQDSKAFCGYEYTKYLADQLVHKAQKQGLLARIYRLDDILPAIDSGHPNQSSLLHLYLKTCLRYQSVVKQSGKIGLLPVDVFAEWICNFVGEAERFSRSPSRVNVVAVCHVQFEDLVRFVARGVGLTLDTVAYASFLARLDADRNNEAALLRSMLPGIEACQEIFKASSPSSKDDHSALALPPWRGRFSLDLDDFTPFVEYMERELDLSSARQQRV
jgi:thioester reductase-like protein